MTAAKTAEKIPFTPRNEIKAFSENAAPETIRKQATAVRGGPYINSGCLVFNWA